MTMDDVAPVTTGRTIGWAEHYDAVVAIMTLGRARAIRTKTADVARIAPGEIVLDVGCGTGDLTMVTQARTSAAGRVYGIDAAPAMIAVARRKAAQAGRVIDYRVAAVEALPFPDATFDVVVSSLMMHHLPDDLKGRGLTEIRRVLKPNGRLLVVDAKRPAGRLGRVALALLVHHQMRSGVQDLPPLMEAAGFTAVEAGETGFRSLGFARGWVREAPAAAISRSSP
jgi:ubiquinone/menaquinone biosynthesis C-methylase UbiE